MKQIFGVWTVLAACAVFFSGSLFSCEGSALTDVEIIDEPLPAKDQNPQEALLAGLGVDTSWVPPVDKNGNALPDWYNPLIIGSAAGSRKSYHATKELYLNWVHLDEYKHENWFGFNTTELEQWGALHLYPDIWTYEVTQISAIYKNFTGQWTSTNGEMEAIRTDLSEQAWLGYPKKAVAGDFDGDGYDEVLIAAADIEAGKITFRLGKESSADVFTIEIARLDFPGGASGLSKALPANNGTELEWGDDLDDYHMENEYLFYRMDMSVGDIDADGMAEAVLVVGREVYVIERNGEAMNTAQGWDTGGAWSFAHIRSLENWKTWSIASVTCADYNNDSFCDWVEALSTVGDSERTAEFVIYDGSTYNAEKMTVKPFDAFKTGPMKIETLTGGTKLESVNMVAGDFDGDGLPETAFCGRELGSDDYKLVVLDTTLDASEKPAFTFIHGEETLTSLGYNVPRNGAHIPALAAGDLTGDGKDELFAVWKVFTLKSGSLTDLWTLPSQGSNTFYDVITAGDVSGDGKADVLYLDWWGRLICVNHEAGSFKYRALSNEGCQMVPKTPFTNKYKKNAMEEFFTPFPVDVVATGIFPAIALGNINDDGYIMQYDGSELVFSDPVVAAVIASPPFYGDVSYPGTLGETVYGMEDTGGHVIQAEVLANLTLQDGTKVDASPLLASLGANIDYTVTFNGLTTTAAAGVDTVIFTAVPFYIFNYTLINAPKGSKDGPAGTTLSSGAALRFDYPGKMGVYSVSLDYYNLHNDDLPDLSVPHTVGKPFTYSSFAEAEALMEEMEGKGVFDLASPLFTTMSNRNWTTREITDVTTGKDLDWEFVTLTNCVDSSGGVAVHTLTHKITPTLYVKGKVPDFPATASTKSPYNWGLLMYSYGLVFEDTDEYDDTTGSEASSGSDDTSGSEDTSGESGSGEGEDEGEEEDTPSTTSTAIKRPSEVTYNHVTYWVDAIESE